MINIKSEVLQETSSNYIYDTKVYLEGTIDSLLGEASTALCKLVEVIVEMMVDNLGEDVSEDTLEVKQTLLKTIYSLSKDILIKGEDINI